jgi:hypothetical protein
MALTVVILAVAALAGCASGGREPTAASMHAARSSLQTYMREIEPLRLGVNRLLLDADPIDSAFHDRRISRAVAARRLGELERRFAAYAVDVAAVVPAEPELSTLQAAYAHTYVLEDAYLSALTDGVAEGDLTDLPNTEAAQRAAIIEWRIGLTVLARQAGIVLPADLQQAGRGEIRPDPDGS